MNLTLGRIPCPSLRMIEVAGFSHHFLTKKQATGATLQVFPFVPPPSILFRCTHLGQQSLTSPTFQNDRVGHPSTQKALLMLTGHPHDDLEIHRHDSH